MKTINKIRAGVAAALALAFATQAHVASAAVFCRAFWPATITDCQGTNSSRSIVDRANGSGLNVTSGSNNRQIKINWQVGTVNAQAGALDSNGRAIAGCTFTDLSKTDGTKTGGCFTADPPAAFFMTAD